MRNSMIALWYWDKVTVNCCSDGCLIMDGETTEKITEYHHALINFYVTADWFCLSIIICLIKAEDVDLMVERMDEQMKQLTKAFREELTQIEVCSLF